MRVVVAICVYSTMETKPEETRMMELVPKVPFPTLVMWNFLEDRSQPDSWTCRNCGQRDVKKARSNGNLLKHCANTSCFGFTYRGWSDDKCQKDMQPIFKAYHLAMATERDGQGFFKRQVSPKARQIKQWIDLIVKCNMPLSACENPTMRMHTKTPGMSRKTLRKYIIKLADILGLIIQDCIGPGNCIADAWSCAGIHYLAIYHQWPSRNNEGKVTVNKALLSCAPFISETSFDAKNQAKSILATYELYGDPEELIVCMTMDNTNTNPATARFVACPMIAAKCHLLNLASREWLEDAFNGQLMNYLQVIHAIMLRASTLKGRGKLKEFSPYIPEVQNKTRWTGYQDMARKYDKMHGALDKTGDYNNIKDDDVEEIEVQGVDDPEEGKTMKVKPVLLSGRSLQTFRNDMLPALLCLRHWFKIIQSELLTMKDARKAFDMARMNDKLKGHSPRFEARLLPSHDLIKWPDFENGIHKIQSGLSEDLTEDEKRSCECLLKNRWRHIYKDDGDKEQEDQPHGPYSPTKFFKDLREERAPAGNCIVSQYITDLSWISPTTVIVERLFSKNRNVLTFNRRRSLPRVFEAIVFLKENIDYWDEKLVQEMVSGRWDDRLKTEYSSDSDEEEEDL